MNPPVLMNKILLPSKSYSKLNRTEAGCNEPRYNQFPLMTNTMQKPKCKLYSDITNNMSSWKWSWMRNRWSILKESQFFVNILFIQWRPEVPYTVVTWFMLLYSLSSLSFIGKENSCVPFLQWRIHFWGCKSRNKGNQSWMNSFRKPTLI